MTAVKRLAALVALMSGLLCADGAAAADRLPKFSDYPARVFTGKPVRPKIDTQDKYYNVGSYRAAARDGVTFAGHYTIVELPCGTTCVNPDILNLRTGRTVNIPFNISGWNEYHDKFEPITVKKNSRLIVFAGARNEKHPVGYHYYVLERGKLRFLRTVVVADGNFMEPLPKD